MSLGRLQKKKEIDAVFKKGKNFREGMVLLKALKKDSGPTRFAFVISQKVSKKATVRNKLRRRIRSIAQKSLDNLKSIDVLVIAFPGLEKKEYRELESLVTKVLKKIEKV